jgi:hypothetical protein
MQCKLCIKLKEATAISVRPDPPNLVLGLNEAGLRNRAWQKEELILKAEGDLKRHQRSCQDKPAF